MTVFEWLSIQVKENKSDKNVYMELYRLQYKIYSTFESVSVVWIITVLLHSMPGLFNFTDVWNKMNDILLLL